MISKKTFNLLLFALPSVIILVIIIIMLHRSEAKAYAEQLKNLFEEQDAERLTDNLSPEFYQKHNIKKDDVLSYLENFFENFGFPEVYIRYKKINKISSDQYSLSLIIRVLAVPKKGTLSGIYGDRRVIVFGDGLRGRAVRIEIIRAGGSFSVADFDIGKPLANEIK